MFWEYWKLACSPFDNVPDPKMYCDRNPSLEDAISEILFAIDEGNDCLAVMVGDIGLGKTLALRVIMDELDPKRYQIVFVTNPDLTFVQLLREIVGQLKGKAVDIRYKDALSEEFNRHLFEAAAKGKRVVMLIDEANSLSRHCLQNLRLLTNMQDDDRNLVSIVLAGQLELGRKLTHRQMENLFQRVGVYCQIKPLETAEMVRDYVEFRLQRAGAGAPIFTPEAISRIFHFTRGVPRLINKLCKLALKAGETNGLTLIEPALIDGIALMFDKERVANPERIPPLPAGEPVEQAAPEAPPAPQGWGWAASPLSDWGKKPAAGGAPQDALPAEFPQPPARPAAAKAKAKGRGKKARPKPQPWSQAKDPMSEWGRRPVAGGAPQDALPAQFPGPVQAVAGPLAEEVAPAAPQPVSWGWASSPLSNWNEEEGRGGAPADALPAQFPEPVHFCEPVHAAPAAPQPQGWGWASSPLSNWSQEAGTGGAPADAQPAAFPEPVINVPARQPQAPAKPARPKPAPEAASRPQEQAAPRRRLSLVQGGEAKAANRTEPPKAAPAEAPQAAPAGGLDPEQPALSAEQLGQIITGLSAQVVESLRAMDERQVIKLAGELAAKEMWQHEKAIRLSHGDPIDFWERSRAQIAAQLRMLSSRSSSWAAGEA